MIPIALRPRVRSMHERLPSARSPALAPASGSRRRIERLRSIAYSARSARGVRCKELEEASNGDDATDPDLLDRRSGDDPLKLVVLRIELGDDYLTNL